MRGNCKPEDSLVLVRFPGHLRPTSGFSDDSLSCSHLDQVTIGVKTEVEGLTNGVQDLLTPTPAVILSQLGSVLGPEDEM